MTPLKYSIESSGQELESKIQLLRENVERIMLLAQNQPFSESLVQREIESIVDQSLIAGYTFGQSAYKAWNAPQTEQKGGGE